MNSQTMDGRTTIWMGSMIDGCMDRLVDERINERLYERMIE